MTECINVYRATQSIARSLLSCGVSLSRWIVDVSKQPNLLSNFFNAWWPHHSSFPKVEPTAKFRRGSPSTGAPNRVGTCGSKNLRFSTSISEIPIPIPNMEVFQNTDTEYRTDMKKYRQKYRIPIPTPNTNTDPALIDSKYINVQNVDSQVEPTFETRLVFHARIG